MLFLLSIHKAQQRLMQGLPWAVFNRRFPEAVSARPAGN